MKTPPKLEGQKLTIVLIILETFGKTKVAMGYWEKAL